MALNSEQQVRLTIYGFLAFIILVAGYFFMQIMQQADNLSSVAGNGSNNGRQEYANSDTSILETQKFKELQAVVVPDNVTSSTTVTSTVNLTPAQLSALPRNKNPFSPSF